jgi:uncharacterized membrane protein
MEGYLMIALCALAGFTAVVALVASLFIRREQVQAAADLAALAAVQSQECEVAAEAARRNGASLRACTVHDAEALVTVATPSLLGDFLLSAGAPREYLASAHAAV